MLIPKRAKSEWGLSELEGFLTATPTAELEPITYALPLMLFTLARAILHLALDYLANMDVSRTLLKRRAMGILLTNFSTGMTMFRATR